MDNCYLAPKSHAQSLHSLFCFVTSLIKSYCSLCGFGDMITYLPKEKHQTVSIRQAVVLVGVSYVQSCYSERPPSKFNIKPRGSFNTNVSVF